MILQLSRRVQRESQRRAVHIGLTNGLGFGFITGQTIYLIALLYGAHDGQMGFLYATPFLATLAVLFVPVLLHGRETTRMWSGFWWLRTVFCLGYFAVPWIGDPAWRVWLFLLLYFLFMVTRAFGMAGYFTVLRALAPPRENSSLMARTFGAGQIGLLLATVISFVVAERNLMGSEEMNLFLLIGIGTCFNALTAWKIGRLPQTGYLDDGSLRGLVQAARSVFRQPPLREVAVTAAFHAAIVVTGGYLISYMRNVAGYGADQIFFITVIGVLVSIGVARLLKMIGWMVRPRILLFSAHGVLGVLAVIWALIHKIPWLADDLFRVAGLYGLSILCLTVSTTVSLQLRSGRLPQHKSVEISVVFDIMQVIGAMLALAVTMLVTGIWGQYIPGLHPYSLHFLVWTFGCAGICIFTASMKTGAAGGFLGEFTALLPSSIFTIIRANRLDQEENPIRRHLNLEGLLLSPSRVSQELILDNLRSPDSGVRGSCIRALMGYPLDASIPALLEEASSTYSPLRSEAITALSFTGRGDLVPELWRLWDQADPGVRASLVKALLRLGAPLTDEQIYRVWQECPSGRQGDIFIGLAVSAGRVQILFRLLAEELAREPDFYWSQSLLGWVAAAAQRRASMLDIFSEENKRPGGGITHLFANYEGSWPAALPGAVCRELLDQRQHERLVELMRAELDEPWICVYDRSSALGVLFLFLLRYHGDFPLEQDA